LPLAQIYVWKGFSEENVKKIITGVTKVFVDMGIPQQAVEVIINEIPKSHWGVNGKLSTESLPNEGPPQ